MKTLSQAGPERKGFVFPGQFEITVMGDADAALAQRTVQILANMGLHVLHETMRYRHSRQRRFLALTVSFQCDTRVQYDAVHAALRVIPGIRLTL